ncbi:MAG: prephenate dehydrogenase/arogenate dehydrogenase family protein [Desulfobacterales bacterium]|nr:prephenate dehydrogenase/arogenate dehydrogenase family protein [Desulfobacterales bacterium]
MIGLIGFGRFGALTAGYLARDFPVYVHSRSQSAETIAGVGAVSASLKSVCRQAYIILSVPISAMPRTLGQIAPLLKPGSVVIDVCSVKIHPLRWMREHLPEDVHILGTHPMFGPDSAADSLEDRKLVLCPERIPSRRYDRVRRYLENKKLIVIETTPEDHDRQIAVSLSLTHFIGRSLSAFGAGALEIDTEGYRRLVYTLGVVEHDSWQLFEDMHRYNPYARQTRNDFMQAMRTIDKQLTPD